MTKNELYWEIDVCKRNLKATDYKAIKHSEGLISDEDYEEIKAQRESWRADINSYEEMIANEEYDVPEEVIDELIDEVEELIDVDDSVSADTDSFDDGNGVEYSESIEQINTDDGDAEKES